MDARASVIGAALQRKMNADTSLNQARIVASDSHDIFMKCLICELQAANLEEGTVVIVTPLLGAFVVEYRIGEDRIPSLSIKPVRLIG